MPIVAAYGLTMPKTSSRAITSPEGTADNMEIFAPVSLDLPTLRRVVEREGGCIAWGGALRLSPADDVLIRVERALELDAERQLVAQLVEVGREMGLHVVPVVTDGSAPVGRGLGPALEACDVRAVLRREAQAPADLRERALLLAGHVPELSADVAPGAGRALAQSILDDGRAWQKSRRSARHRVACTILRVPATRARWRRPVVAG